jgi:unsaturated chondroitin disaccharide hydrolase
MNIDTHLRPESLLPALYNVFNVAGRRVLALTDAWDAKRGSPVVTVRGCYTSRAWTDWTAGFLCGMPLLVFEATDERRFLDLGRAMTLKRMPAHLTDAGVHDHGFNTISTYGNLWRLAGEGRFKPQKYERELYELAIKVSGAVQAMRWTPGSEEGAKDGCRGFVYSFNGPHSLFIDTMRTLRVLALSHHLGHVLYGEQDQSISLLGRAIAHALTTARHLIDDGKSESPYAARGRTAHEGLFNVQSGQFRAPATQQGYSPFTTWTRGLAWAILGFAEQLEFLATRPDREIRSASGLAKDAVLRHFRGAAAATADYYLDRASALDGIPYWDDGAPGLARLGDWRSRHGDPFNDHEPVDSSAAAIAAQGLLRLGHCLGKKEGASYTQAGLTIARTLLSEPYLATSAKHQGLLLHSVYHRPAGWDHIPRRCKVPCGESSMWGDYHLLELAVLIHRLAHGESLSTFFG